ncbi:MAG: UDP-N-acetylglucosamine 1-carboxyvinyltransferase [Patescibacteria group bacterium]
MSQKIIITGGKKLQGNIKVSGSKNSALPLMCAALLARTSTTLTNVPEIEDTKSLIKIFESIGVVIEKNGNTLVIHPEKITTEKPSDELVKKMRAAALLAAPLLVRNGKVDMAFPGGCVLGKRTLHAHTFVFEKFGATILEQEKALKLEATKLHSAEIVMPEASVTATENALMIAASLEGKTEIRLAACEPHVQDLCEMLNKMGAQIEGIGTHTLIIHGTKNLHGVTHEIMGDYLEAGTFAVAAAITGGDVTISGLSMHHLDSFWQKFEEAGVPYEIKGDTIRIQGSQKMKAIAMIKTAVHPNFPTDLQAPFAVLLTQAEGVSKIFETLFDGRLSYLFELEKMGARFEMLNPHQAIIIGKTELTGADIASCDIRAGAAMILAALAAKGQTSISNIVYIDRGYERIVEKFQSLGADIERIQEESPEGNIQKVISTVPSKSVRRIEAPTAESRERASA